MSIAKNTLKNAINDIDVEQYRKDMQKAIKHWVFVTWFFMILFLLFLSLFLSLSYIAYINKNIIKF